MPRRAHRICNKPGCGELCDSTYCPKHTEQSDAGARAFDEHRGSAASRGYGRTWRRLSKYIIARDPLCRIAKICTSDYAGQLPAPSTCADHIIPKSKGGLDREDNLQGACERCHSWKTRTQDSALAARDSAKRSGVRENER